MSSSCTSKRFDWVLWGSLAFLAAGYLGYWLIPEDTQYHHPGILYAASVYELVHQMALGFALGLVFVSALTQVPQDWVFTVIGMPGSRAGVLRAVIAGVLLDLCSHGVLLVGMKLYSKGASLGQTLAFLISTPWNSLSLTIVLVTLLGWKWTLIFVLSSMFIALISGWIFDECVRRRILPANPHHYEPSGRVSWKEVWGKWRGFDWSLPHLIGILGQGIRESRMIFRWLFLGMVAAAWIRAGVSTETLETYLGPSIAGLLLTWLGATLIEVCSEGSAPIGAELVNRAGAPGNGFTFLMAGASTDATELIAIRQQTQSTRTMLFLPLVTLPQILVLSYIMNGSG